MSDNGFGSVELDETEHLTSGERRTSREYEMVSLIVFFFTLAIFGYYNFPDT
jgi:hypothetical protein